MLHLVLNYITVNSYILRNSHYYYPDMLISLYSKMKIYQIGMNLFQEIVALIANRGTPTPRRSPPF